MMKKFPAFSVLFLLSFSTVCISHIIIDPLILLDASSRLPALLLSAEVQNVKDLANSLFSPENMDVLSTIAADTINMAKNTILLAQQSVDIQSIADAVTNSAPVAKLGSAIDGILSSSPVLLSSPSEFASSFTSKIAESADNFLASNPDLAKPTSAYASDLIANIYSDVVQPKMSSILATLDASPLAENTRQAIDQSPKLVQNAQELLSSRLAQLSEFKNKLSESAGVSDFLSASKSAVGSRINENFDKIISDYPQLKQSTSDFTVSAVNNQILPKIKETSEFLYNSPLGLNTREFAARSTSDVVSSFSADVATRFSPYTDVIGSVGNRLFVRATSPFTDLVAGLNAAAQSSTLDAQKISQDFLTVQRTALPSIPENADLTNILSEQKLNLISKGNAVVENIVPTAQTAVSAVLMANTRLLSELQTAGGILGGNILNLGIATGDVTAKILVSAATTGSAVIDSIGGSALTAPEKFTELAAAAPSTLQELSDAALRGATDVTGRTFETVSSGVESSVSAVTRWKFFSDENHWENGFWEQKLKALQNLKQSDFSNQNLENLNKQVLATLESAGKRFTDQYEASRSRSYSTLGLQESFNFAEVKNYDVYSRNLAAFQMNMKTASETAISLTDTIVKNGGAAVQELSKLKETSVQLLTQELLSNDYL